MQSSLTKKKKKKKKIAASVAEAAAVNSEATKTLLANGVSAFIINSKLAVINDLRK